MIFNLFITFVLLNYVCSYVFNTVPFIKRFNYIKSIGLSKLSLQGRLQSSQLQFKVSAVETEVRNDIEIEEDEVVVNKSGSLLRKLSKGFVPIAASIGFAVTPSSSLAYRLAGATVGGITGFIAKKFIIDKLLPSETLELDHKDRDNTDQPPYSREIKAALLETLRKPEIFEMTLKDYEKIAKRNKVKPNEIGIYFTYLFSELLIEMISNNSIDFTELSEIIDWANNIELTSNEIADGFTLASIKLSKYLEINKKTGFFNEKYSKNIILYSAKLLFLGDKLLESFEGYFNKRFYTSVTTLFPIEILKEMITNSSKKLYLKLISNILLKPENFSNDMIDTLTKYLQTNSLLLSDFRPNNMQNMISESIQSIINNDLPVNILSNNNKETIINNKIELTNYNTLNTAKDILGWKTNEFTNLVELKTLPIFETQMRYFISDIFDNSLHSSKYSNDYIQSKMNLLHLEPLKARIIIITLLTEYNLKFMNTLEKILNASKGSIDPIYKILLQYYQSYIKIKEFTSELMDSVSLPLPGLPFVEMIRANLYELNLRGNFNSLYFITFIDFCVFFF